MAYFKVNRFSGIAPAVSPRLLAQQFAQISENLRFESGRFDPLAIEGSSVAQSSIIDVDGQSTSTRRSIYYFDSDSTTPVWLAWASEGVKAVEGPIPGDNADRLYWTGHTYPRMATRSIIGTGHYRLGVPAPDAAPSVSISGTADESMTAEETAYVYTFVTDYGEEGPPSPASTIVEATIKSGAQTVTLSNLNSYGGASSPYAFNTSTAKKRIYRANVGSSSTQYQLVDEIPYTQNQHPDSKESSQLSEVLPSTTWIGPPDDDTNNYPNGPLEGLTPIANGVFAGFSGKRLCLSEAYLPHAWPVDYRITMENDIVAIGTTANGIVALTDGKPYFVTGVDPSAMTAVQINFAQGCVNPRSVVDLGDIVLYAGPDGLCGITGTEGRVLTQGLISPTQWNNDFAPTTLRAFEHEGTYVAFYISGSSYHGWVYDPRAEEAAISTLTTSAERRAGYRNPKTGDLFLSIGVAIQPYAASTTTNRQGVWKSKVFVTEKPVSMGWISVIAPNYPQAVYANNVLSYGGTVTVTVWADKVQIAEYNVLRENSTSGRFRFRWVDNAGNAYLSGYQADAVFRLPAVIATEWELQVKSYVAVDEVCIAETLIELKQT